MPPKDNIDFDQNYLNEDEEKDFFDEIIEADDFANEGKHPLNIDVQDDPDDDLTDDDIDDILGKSSNKRRLFIIGGVIIAAVVAFWFFSRGGEEVAVDEGEAEDSTVIVAAEIEEDSIGEALTDSIIAEALVADTTKPTLEFSEMQTIPADSLPAELQPHFESDTTLKQLDTTKQELEPLYKDFTVTNRFPTMRLMTGALSDEELFDSSLEPDPDKFEWMLRVDLTKDEIIDTLPDSDDEFYRSLLEVLREIDIEPLADQEELTAMLYQPVEEDVDTVGKAQKKEYVVVHDTVVVKDPSVVAANDSLAVILKKLQKALNIAHEDIASLQGEVKKFSKAAKTAEDSVRDIEIRKLAKILSKMSPAEAVARLDGRSTDELIELLFLLRQREAAKIIEELPPEKGQAVATKIFRR